MSFNDWYVYHHAQIDYTHFNSETLRNSVHQNLPLNSIHISFQGFQKELFLNETLWLQKSSIINSLTANIYFIC